MVIQITHHAMLAKCHMPFMVIPVTHHAMARINLYSQSLRYTEHRKALNAIGAYAHSEKEYLNKSRHLHISNMLYQKTEVTQTHEETHRKSSHLKCFFLLSWWPLAKREIVTSQYDATRMLEVFWGYHGPQSNSGSQLSHNLLPFFKSIKQSDDHPLPACSHHTNMTAATHRQSQGSLASPAQEHHQ